MNTTAAAKACSICAVNLNGQKRIKDEQGLYFCYPCWNARHSDGGTRPPQVASDVSKQKVTNSGNPIEPPVRPTSAKLPPNYQSPDQTPSPVQGGGLSRLEVRKSRIKPTCLAATAIIAIVVLGFGVGMAITKNKSAEGPDRSAVPSNPLQTAKLADDPVASFTTFFNAFVAKGKALSAAAFARDKITPYALYPEEMLSMNVTKTDSLVSPFIGTISGRIATTVEVPAHLRETLGDGFQRHEFTVYFAAQNNRWILKSVSAHDYDQKNVNTNTAIRPFVEEIYDSISQ